jgi:hypothetical protein
MLNGACSMSIRNPDSLSSTAVPEQSLSDEVNVNSGGEQGGTQTRLPGIQS